MPNPLIQLHTVYQSVRAAAADGLHQLLERLKTAWQRHLEYMSDREGYRAQVVAGVAALVAVLDLDPRVAAVLLALLGLHAAAHGHAARSPRPHPLFQADEEDSYVYE